MGVGFGIWAGISLFWDVASVRALTEGGDEWFEVRFELEGNRVGGLGGVGNPFQSGSSQMERAGDWIWNLGRDFPILGRGYREGSC